jgi:hypothetical protein
MKHLKEYEDEDVRDLMGDLETVGHEQLKGYYIQTTSDSGYTNGFAIFAHNEGELIDVIKQMFPSYRRTKGFPERMGQAYKGPNNLYNNFLDAFQSWLSHNELSLTTIVLKDLTIRNVSQVEPGGVIFPAYNPFMAAKMLNKCFTNVEEKMTSGGFEEEFNDETEAMTIPYEK